MTAIQKAMEILADKEASDDAKTLARMMFSEFVAAQRVPTPMMRILPDEAPWDNSRFFPYEPTCLPKVMF